MQGEVTALLCKISFKHVISSRPHSPGFSLLRDNDVTLDLNLVNNSSCYSEGSNQLGQRVPFLALLPFFLLLTWSCVEPIQLAKPAENFLDHKVNGFLLCQGAELSWYRTKTAPELVWGGTTTQLGQGKGEWDLGAWWGGSREGKQEQGCSLSQSNKSPQPQCVPLSLVFRWSSVCLALPALAWIGLH